MTTHAIVASILTALTLAACGPHGDLSQPFRVDVEVPVPDEWNIRQYDAARVTSYVRAALRELGGRDADDAVQVVSVRPSVNCDGGDAATVAYTSNTSGTIWLCPVFLGLPPTMARQVVFHELGHRLGAGHVPCRDGVMAADVGCYAALGPRGEIYTAADVDEVCRASTGGVCSP